MKRKLILISTYFALISNALSALDQADRAAIHALVEGYTEAWNEREGKGFGDSFADDADFVNIFGTVFTGRQEIEERHIQILQTFLKNSTFEVINIRLREVQQGVVVALVPWKVYGFRSPGSDMNAPGDLRQGIFTQLFIKKNAEWKITASQNTLVPLPKKDS